jgi:hypothetical protein
MTARKTPILLRRAPLSGEVMALYRYTRKTIRGREVLDTGMDGKQPVTDDWESLVVEWLLEDAPDLVGILDGCAQECYAPGLTAEERAQVRIVRERIKDLVVRHNARMDAQR